jgi:D-glycero-D-manno-heptose 1,7-bisphosphate phosphatase
MLAEAGVRLAGFYYCPHHPEGIDQRYAIACSCRKPNPGLLYRAAAEHGIDLEQSWLIGDILDDVEAGHRAGCRSILVDLGTETLPDRSLRAPDYVARDTAHALAIVAGVEGLGPEPELTYRPACWRPPRFRVASFTVSEAGGAG